MKRTLHFILACVAAWLPGQLCGQGLERQPKSFGLAGEADCAGTQSVTALCLELEQARCSVLHSFTGSGGDGVNPQGSLVQGSDGALYGITPYGGSSDWGTVFRIGPDGAGYRVLHTFTGSGGDSANPEAGLILGADGALYGTTRFGGSYGMGTVFRLGTSGAGFRVLHSFSGWDGAQPYGGLVQGTDGGLYGTTYGGGTNGWGTVFRLSTTGAGFRVLYRFTGTGGDGELPFSALVQGRDGALYGTTIGGGGANNCGTVFCIGTNGAGYRVLYRFTGSDGDGCGPAAPLVQGWDGALYGTTCNGGTNNAGTVFRLGTDGTGYRVLFRFPGVGEGGGGPTGLVQGSDGALYGATGGGTPEDRGMAFCLGTDGTGYRVLYSFTGSGGDGANPFAPLLQGRDGALYGTSLNGGDQDYGTVFRLELPATGAVTVSGNGRIVTNSITRSAAAGVRCTLTAKPAPGYVFAGWSGSLTSNAAKLTFSAQPDTVLVANFVPSPFPALAGTFSGLFYETDKLTAASCGLVRLQLARGGALSGRVCLGGTNYPVSGRFLGDGTYAHAIVWRDTSFTLQLRLNSAEGETIEGTLKTTNWQAEVIANRAPYCKAHPASYAGRYTLALAGAEGSPDLPAGEGALALTVSQRGVVRVHGRLGDGTPVSAGALVSGRGEWPLYAMPYAEKGLLVGWLAFTNDLATLSDLEGRVGWIKPPQTNAKCYAKGFTWPLAEGENNAFGSTYTDQSPLLGWSNGVAVLEFGNLSRPLSCPFVLCGDRGLGTNRLHLRVNTRSGQFQGSLLSPERNRRLTFHGVLLQKRNTGNGFFIGRSQSGRVGLLE